MKKITLGLIRAYQKFWFSFSHAACRFQPTCSEYTYQAVERYGIIGGTWRGLKRILRCHPWHQGGLDPL